ncbi:glycosyltransferase family 4 protein [Chromobacterium vaccinii]|uniref:Glycosyltransferase family 4 protein n=1 Tax=Chromobacterium vaccinii TaxID=1108595 RepID=A0ABV0F927_9NEIS
MRVLYIDGVGPFGGASRSLFEAVRALKDRGVKPYFVATQGTALDFYGQVAEELIATRGLTRFDNTNYSHYRGMRWLVLLREFFHLPFTILAIHQAHRKWKGKIDLIHVNEVTEIIPGLLAKRLFKVPMVVHVRSPQWVNQQAWRSRWINGLLKRSASAVIAIDNTTRATLSTELTVDVVQNSFTPRRSATPDPAMLLKLEKLRTGSLKVGFVGNVQVSKGILDLVEAAKLLNEQGADVEFVVVGGHTRATKGLKGWLLQKAGLAQDVVEELERRIKHYGLEKYFHLLGATSDIQCVYECLDVIAFPSHFDAPGRPVFEAAFSAVPSIVCVSKPLADTLVHNQTGLAIPARDPRALSEAIRHFEKCRDEVARMGRQAQQLAIENFEPRRNATRLHDIYKRIYQPT